MPFDRHARLTPRERDISRLLLEGLGLKQVAMRLGLSVETVRTYVKHQHAKTDTQNLHSLALWANAHRRCCVDPA